VKLKAVYPGVLISGSGGKTLIPLTPAGMIHSLNLLGFGRPLAFETRYLALSCVGGEFIFVV